MHRRHGDDDADYDADHDGDDEVGDGHDGDDVTLQIASVSPSMHHSHRCANISLFNYCHDALGPRIT